MEKVEQLSATVAQLAQRVEDLEDLRDLEQAIVENGKKPLVPWAQARKELRLV
jgi:hypothetical protein